MRASGWLRGLYLSLVMVPLAAQLPGTAQAQSAATAPAGTEQQARAAFEAGRIHYDNGEFDAAAVSFEEAYRLSGREGLLYNIYLAYRDASAEEKAAEALRSYLARVEVIENRAQLEARLKALDAGIQQKQREQAEQAEQAQQAQQAQQAEQRRAEESRSKAVVSAVPELKPRWWLMPVSVMGAGGALALGSVVTGVMAQSKANELEDNCSNGQCDESLRATADSGRTLAVVTDVLLFGGLATVAVGGALLYFKRPHGAASGPEQRPRANLSCARSGCHGSVSMRF